MGMLAGNPTNLGMSTMDNDKITSEQLSAARNWIADCEWKDNDTLDDLTNHEIVRGINRHYVGGWKAFTSHIT